VVARVPVPFFNTLISVRDGPELGKIPTRRIGDSLSARKTPAKAVSPGIFD
jgi:hypothetical protein